MTDAHDSPRHSTAGIVNMGIGEGAGLAAAACWACASLLYGSTKLSAWGMNFGKNILATCVLFLQLVVLATLNSTTVLSAGRDAWWWLSLSGIIGIVLGDTLYFRSLQILGPRKALMVSTTAPVFAAVLGFVLLEEVLTPMIITGIALTTGGVIYVVADKKSSDKAPGLFPGSTVRGVLAGCGAAICQAVGGVCSRIGMTYCDGVEGAFIRLAVSACGVFLIVLARREVADICRRLADRQLLKRFVPAVLLGTWLGIWLSQIAYKHTSVSVATTMLATTPLFAVPLVRIVYGYRITAKAITGTITAVLGIALIVAPQSLSSAGDARSPDTPYQKTAPEKENKAAGHTEVSP